MAQLEPSHYYLDLAAAFCRGSLGLPAELRDQDAIEAGHRAGLRLSKFKRNAELPRVRRVLGALKGFAPHTLLDVGSGRGTFLWPLLDAMPSVSVTALEVDAVRLRDLQAVAKGSERRLVALDEDVREADLEAGGWDGVTLLEVLEHLPDPERAVSTAVRCARRFIVASVPSKPDDNPEHLHVIAPDQMTSMFTAAGAANVRFEYVPNHLIVTATL